MTRRPQIVLLLLLLLNAAWVDELFAQQSPVATLHLNNGQPIVKSDGVFTVAAINKGRSGGFVEGRMLEIKRSRGGQERVIGFARVTAAEQDYSFVVVESPPGLIPTTDDRFAIAQAEPGAFGFKFMTTEGLKRSPTFISFFDNERLLLIGNQDEFMIWDWRRGQKVQSATNWHGVYFSAFSLNKMTNKLHVLGSSALYEWDLNRMEISKSVQVKKQRPFPTLAEAQDGGVIVHTAGRNEAIVLDAELKEVGRFGEDKNLGNMSYQTDLSPDGTRFLTVHTRLELGGPGGLESPRAVLLWDVKTRRLIRKLAEQAHDPRLVRFVPPDNSLVYDTDDGQLAFVSASGERLASTPLGENGLTGLTFSPDGKLFATNNRIGEIKLWKYPSLESRVIASDGPVGANPVAVPIAFSSDGKFVSAGLADNAVGIWDVSTGNLLRRLEGASRDVANILVSKDGKRLVVAGKRDIETWDLSGTGMSARPVPDVKFAALGAVSGRMISVGRAKKKKYFSPIPGFDPENLALSVWNGGVQTEVMTWGVRELEDYAVTPDEKYFVRADVFNVSTWSLTDGAFVHSRAVVSDDEYERLSSKEGMSNSLLMSKVQLSSDGRAIVVSRDDGLLRMWEFDSGRIGKDLYTAKFQGIEAFAVSPDSNTIVVANGVDKLVVVDRRDGKTLYEVRKPGISIDKIVWDPQATKFAVVASNRLHVFAAQDGAGLYSKQFITSIGDIVFSSDGVFLFVGGSGGQTHVLRASDGNRIVQLVVPQSDFKQKPTDGNVEKARQLVAQVVCYVNCDANDSREVRPRWLGMTEKSRFDTDGFWEDSEFSWVAADSPLVPIAPEIFMRDYYEPRLLPRLLACLAASPPTCDKTFRPVRQLATLNRIQPGVRILKSEQGSLPNKAVVTVEASAEDDATQPNDKTHTDAYDLRLFRDGELVGQWPEAADGSDEIGAWRQRTRLEPGAGAKTVIHEFVVELPTLGQKDSVLFTAYAFNEDRVKSATASLKYALSHDIAPREAIAYVVTIGANSYDAPARELRFAVRDAEAMRERLSKLDGYKVVTVSLASEGNDPTRWYATKANIRAVLSRLAGKSTPPGSLAGVKGADQLAQATPDDLVVVTFSGHGYTAKDGAFYLLPSDSGKDLDPTIKPEVLAKFISSEELSEWLRPIDAGQMAMIIDACHSAASVDQPGFKPGPMGDRGLGQLAYDKAMRILAASQADDVALESEKLKQGLLTYALVHDGLVLGADGKYAADTNHDGKLTLAEWLRYGEQHTPTLFEDIRAGRKDAVYVGRDSVVVPGFRLNVADHAQTPTLFDFAQADSVAFRP